MKTILIFTILFFTIQISSSQEFNFVGGTEVELQNAITSLNGDGTIVINGNLIINNNIIIPEHIALRFIHNYKINIKPNARLTINGVIDANFQQIFIVDAGGILDGNPKIKYAVPHWWHNPLETYWSQAIQHAVDFYPTVYFPQNTYDINTSINLSTEIPHHLYGESNASKLVMLGDHYVFKLKAEAPNQYIKGLTIDKLYFDSTNGIQFNNALTEFNDSVGDHILRVKVTNCHFQGDNTNNGTAIYMSKIFDAEIKNNHIHQYNIGINLRGSDINSIHNNRISNFHTYGILDESFNTFGSQNEISQNDILHYKGTINQGAFIKTFSRHVTIKDNYFENTSGANKIRAIIDCSNYSQSYHPITPLEERSFPFFINISENRLDVTDDTALYTYLIQDDFASLFISDQSNINSYPPSSFINENGNLSTDFIRSRFNVYREKSINIQSATSFGVWNGFKTSSQFDIVSSESVIINSQHAASAIRLTNELTNTDLDIHPLYFKLEGGPNIAAYLVNLTQNLPQNGEKELPKRINITIRFRVLPSNNSNDIPRIYMRGDSNTTQGNSYFSFINTNIPYDEYRSITFTPSVIQNNGTITYVDYIDKLYIEPNNCNIEVKSIEISPYKLTLQSATSN